MQVLASCSNGTVQAASNVVYTKYTIKRLVTNVPAPAGPTITKVTVQPPTSEEPGMMPSLTRPNVYIEGTGWTAAR